MTSLLNAAGGRVYLDLERPRVCLRASENRSRAEDEIFPFYELRAAAVDLSRGGRFSEPETLRRVEAQLDTLIEHGVRHAVLGAFGCGAFRNPAPAVARCYRRAL